jgi:release factor glutamine methyltransferase
VELVQGDLYAPLPEGLRFDVIAANPPYVPTPEVPKLARELSHEPGLAIDGGEGGLGVAARLFAGAPARLVPGGTLVVEMHESHAEILPRLCREAGFASAESFRDLAGLSRYVVARLPGA